ncbi:MAG: hypothetical protein V1755_14485 [Chloroflexota bacterium]
MIYLGIDPGKSGAIVALPHREWIGLDETIADIWLWLRALTPPVTALLEEVHSRPACDKRGKTVRGIRCTFAFGRAFGNVEAALIIAGVEMGIRFERVMPQRWQRAIGLTVVKGEARPDHKRRLKALAQELFPGAKITNQTADAYLLAEVCRRMHRAEWRQPENK